MGVSGGGAPVWRPPSASAADCVQGSRPPFFTLALPRPWKALPDPDRLSCPSLVPSQTPVTALCSQVASSAHGPSHPRPPRPSPGWVWVSAGGGCCSQVCAPGRSRSQSLCQWVRPRDRLLIAITGCKAAHRHRCRNPKLPGRAGALRHVQGPGHGVRVASRPRCLQAGPGRRVTLCLFPSPAAMKSGGTQLKLVMTFQNYGQALFKPMK